MVIHMKVIVVDDNKKNYKNNTDTKYRLNLFIEWLIYMVGYAIVLLMASGLFRSIYVKNFLYGLLAAIIIFILNKTIKPILVSLSLPLIGISLGLFYFVINVIILFIVDFILGSAFELHGFFFPIIIAMFISLMNLIMENLIIKPIIERCTK